MAGDLARRQLKPIKNLIWIGCNHILPDWRGSYWKERPKDLAVLTEYSRVFENILDNVISLQGWSEDDVKKLTSDNIHPNQFGFELLRGEIIRHLKSMGLA